jgi:hypothetical protein
MTELKKCDRCKETKGMSSFSLTPAKNPRGACKECRSKQHKGTVGRNRKLQHKYKITHQDYLNMLEKQGGVCLGCGAKAEEQYHGVLDVDHNHKTGKVRGLLCNTCNRLLGFAGDKASVLLNLASYLKDKGSYGG